MMMEDDLERTRSPAKAGFQIGVRTLSPACRSAGRTDCAPAFAGEQGGAKWLESSGRGAGDQILGGAVVSDVAGAAPQFGMLAIGELAAALDRQPIVRRFKRAEGRDVTALEDVETVISQGSIPAAGTIRPKHHPYQTECRSILMQIAKSRACSNISGKHSARLSPGLPRRGSCFAKAGGYRSPA